MKRHMAMGLFVVTLGALAFVVAALAVYRVVS